MEELIERITNLEYQVVDLKIAFIIISVAMSIMLTVSMILDSKLRKRQKKDLVKNVDGLNS